MTQVPLIPAAAWTARGTGSGGVVARGGSAQPRGRSFRSMAAVCAGRVVQAVLRRRGGEGSGGPGVVANRLAPRLLPSVLGSFPEGLVVVSGTAGKSTTTKMTTAILRAHGLSVFTNASTANLPQGITSSILDECDAWGRVHADVGVIEMDEAFGARIASSYRARVVTLTNVNLDDIARFESAERVRGLLGAIAARASETVVVNADDATLGRIADDVERGDRPRVVRRFGVSSDVLARQRHGLGHVRTSAQRLVPRAGTRVERVAGADAELSIGGRRAPIALPSRGVHYAVDTAAAIETAKAVLGGRFDPDIAAAAVNTVSPVFGRGETVVVAGQRIECVLVQNTASFQLNIDELPGDRGLVFLGVGDEEDDTSWLWTVDTRPLRAVDVVAGPMADAMAHRLAYDGVPAGRVESDLIRGFEAFLALPTPSSGGKTVVFTSRSMRCIRREYGLRSYAARNEAA